MKIKTNKIYHIQNSNINEYTDRSVLYSVAPLHHDSIFIESLSHYVDRLASYHSMNRNSFFQHILFPTETKIRRKSLSTLQSFQTKQEVCNVLNLLTGRNDLSKTTLLYWQNVLANRGLFRTSNAWCSYCLSEWQKNEIPVYEPLIWTIRDLNICTIHKIKLTEHCPTCNSFVYTHKLDSLYGYCGDCGSYLGNTNQIIDSIDRNDLHDAENLSLIIINMFKNHIPPEMSSLAKILPRIIEDHSNNISVFCKKIGISIETIRNIYYDKNQTKLTSLLKLSRMINVPLHLMLDERCIDELGYNDHGESSILPTKNIGKRSEIEDELHKIIDKDIPISLTQTSKILGITTPRLRRNFPELTDRIINKYENYFNIHTSKSHHNYHAIESQLKELLLDQSKPIPYNDTIRALGYCPNFILNKFPHLANELSNKYQRFRKQNREYKSSVKDLTLGEIEMELNKIIDDKTNPPLSLFDVCNQIGFKYCLISKKFPSQCKLIVNRYKEHRSKISENKILEFAEEITNVILKINKSGQYPSERRIQSFFPNKPAMFKKPDFREFRENSLISLGYQ